MSSQAVFLFDVNSFPKDSLQAEILQKFLSDVRLVCLRLLIELSRKSKNLRFGMKFFNSKGNFSDEKDKHILYDVDLESFENLEKKISDRFGRYAEFSKRLSQQEDRISHFVCQLSPIQLLSLALKEILCDFHWNSPEVSSPVRYGETSRTDDVRKNYVFLFAVCPLELDSFCDTKETVAATKFQDWLMPPALYKKFVEENKITLVWLNSLDRTTTDLTTSEKESISVVTSTLHNMQGKFASLEIFAHADCTIVSNHLNNMVAVPHTSSQAEDSLVMNGGPVVPFSILFSQFLETSHVRHKKDTLRCSLQISDTDCVSLELIPVRINNCRLSRDTLNHQRCSNHLPTAQCNPVMDTAPTAGQWCRFQVKKAIPKHFYGIPDSVYFCHSEGSDHTLIWNVLKHFDRKKQYIVLQCESEDGHIALGLLYSSSVVTFITIYKPLNHLGNHKILSSKQKSKFFSELFESHIQTSGITKKVGVEVSQNSFQMSCMESWFVPTSRISDVVKHMQLDKVSTSHNVSNTFGRLRCEYQIEKKRKRRLSIGLSPIRRSPRLKRQKLNESNQNFGQCIFAMEENVPSLDLDRLDDERVIEFIRESYVSAIDEVKPLYSSASSIVKTTLMYLKSSKESITKKDLWAYLGENIFSIPKDIAAKFNGASDSVSLTQKMREYQMQVLLRLEAETAFPSEISDNTCVNAVIALLRSMLFAVGHSEVTQFLQETIKDIYAVNLRHILEEIEEELDVPIFRDTCPSSPFGTLSPDNNNTRSSLMSYGSVPSCRSSSSVSSQKESIKRPFLSQGALSDNYHKRQIMVPRKLLKKQTAQTVQTQSAIALRRSPRISSRIVQSASVTNTSNQFTPKKVRRNLFSNLQSPNKSSKASPVKGKQRQFTPRGRHVLKTTYVPETPVSKQGRSAIRTRQEKLRRLSGITSTQVREVAESPSCSKKLGGAFSSAIEERLGSGKRRTRADSKAVRKKQPTTSDRKRRWSINGPSSSPRKEDFVKRCSKRLFQNNTPPPKHLPHASQKEIRPCLVVMKNILQPSPNKTQSLQRLTFVRKAILKTPQKNNSIDTEDSNDVIMACPDDNCSIAIPKLDFFGNAVASEVYNSDSDLLPPVLHMTSPVSKLNGII